MDQGKSHRLRLVGRICGKKGQCLVLCHQDQQGPECAKPRVRKLQKGNHQDDIEATESD